MRNKELVIKLSEHIEKIVEKVVQVSVEDVYEALSEIGNSIYREFGSPMYSIGTLANFDDFEAVKSIAALSDIGYHGKEAGIIIGAYIYFTRVSGNKILKLVDARGPIENIQHGANILDEKKYSHRGIFNIFGAKVSPVLIALGRTNKSNKDVENSSQYKNNKYEELIKKDKHVLVNALIEAEDNVILEKMGLNSNHYLLERKITKICDIN